MMEPIQPIAKDLLHEKVSDAIISYIYRNGLKIGDKLPGERQLAQELMVGRNSVRLGLCQLEEAGIIERLVGKGAFVRREVNADSIQLRLARVNYQVERLAIQRAVERASDQQIAHLKGIAQQLCAMADEGRFSVQLDREFHIALLECGGSSTLTQLVLSLIDSLNSFTKILGHLGENHPVPYGYCQGFGTKTNKLCSCCT